MLLIHEHLLQQMAKFVNESESRISPGCVFDVAPRVIRWLIILNDNKIDI